MYPVVKKRLPAQMHAFIKTRLSSLPKLLSRGDRNQKLKAMFRKFASVARPQAGNFLARNIATCQKHCTPKPVPRDNFMARSEKCLNSVQLLGRVGQNPKVAGAQRKVVQFSMATTVYYQPSGSMGTSSPDNLQSKTAWHNIAVFRPYLQDKVENYIKKGSRVLVQGSLEYSTFIDDSGNQRSSVSIIPDDIIILSTPAREESSY